MMDATAAVCTFSSSKVYCTYRSKSRLTVVVDVRLSDDDWPKMSREAEKLAVDLDYDCLSYVHFSILFIFYYDSQSTPSIHMTSYDGCNCSCLYFLFIKSIHMGRGRGLP